MKVHDYWCRTIWNLLVFLSLGTMYWKADSSWNVIYLSLKPYLRKLCLELELTGTVDATYQQKSWKAGLLSFLGPQCRYFSQYVKKSIGIFHFLFAFIQGVIGSSNNIFHCKKLCRFLQQRPQVTLFLMLCIKFALRILAELSFFSYFILVLQFWTRKVLRWT